MTANFPTALADDQGRLSRAWRQGSPAAAPGVLERAARAARAVPEPPGSVRAGRGVPVTRLHLRRDRRGLCRAPVGHRSKGGSDHARVRVDPRAGSRRPDRRRGARRSRRLPAGPWPHRGREPAAHPRHDRAARSRRSVRSGRRSPRDRRAAVSRTAPSPSTSTTTAAGSDCSTGTDRRARTGCGSTSSRASREPRAEATARARRSPMRPTAASSGSSGNWRMSCSSARNRCVPRATSSPSAPASRS